MPQRKKDSRENYGPGTIESDDEIENYSNKDSDSDDDEVDHGQTAQLFFAGMGSADSWERRLQDAWEEVMLTMKPRKSCISLDDAIAKVRLKEKMKQKDLQEQKEKEEGKEGEEEEGEDGKEKEVKEDDDLKVTRKSTDIVEDKCEVIVEGGPKDILRLREEEVRRKQRKMGKAPRKTKEERDQEKKDAEFFENAPTYNADATFLEMNFSHSILKAIENLGYRQPTPIQAATIPVALQGRDVCACAATGTGKTAAYMLPIMERLLYKPPTDLVTRVLIMVPTRELGVQVFEVAKTLCRFSNIDVGLTVGGLDVRVQAAMLKKVPDVVIATPGRLIEHLLKTPNFSLHDIEILVLDEADRMMDGSFDDQMEEIMKGCARNRQTMLFSATMTSKVKDLALLSLKNPVKVFVNQNTDVAQNLRQEFVRIKSRAKGCREAVLLYLLTRTFRRHVMIFVETRVGVHQLHILLGLQGVRCAELHGYMRQAQRLTSLKRFKDQDVDVLVTTDVAARGLDISGVQTVINFHMPRTYTRYVHRVGRTARAGLCGRSVSLVTAEEYKLMRDIRRHSKTAMYERILRQDIVTKWEAKIEASKEAVRQVLEEEAALKEVAILEHSVQNLENKLKKPAGQNQRKHKNDKQAPKAERGWFNTKDEISAITRHLAQTKGGTVKGKGKNAKKRKAGDPAIDRDIKLAKVQRRTTKLRNKHEDTVEAAAAGPNASMSGKKGKKKTSSFAAELTKTDRRTLKKFRVGPSYQEKKEAFLSKNPGKKFKLKKKN